MNADQERRAEEDASTIDSIALDALGSGTISGKQSSAHSDDRGDESSLRQAQNAGLNMEHVDGERIDEYCDSRRLDVPARLKLFKQVCDAVHFAHQHGIIHRDLKPGNILVRSDGVPRLINFGNAKPIHGGFDDGADTEGLATLMRTGNRRRHQSTPALNRSWERRLQRPATSTRWESSSTCC